MIDDSALIRRTVEIGLGETHGWQVRTAESGAQGLEIASREKPDAILLDVEMPDLDGPGTLNRLQAHDGVQEIPVLFLTGYATDEHHRRLTALGAAGVITKPFDPSMLAAQITQVLGWNPGS